MKRSLLIAAALLTLTGAVHAAEMPERLRGEWCMERFPDGTVERAPGAGFVWLEGECGGNDLVVWKNEFLQGSVICTPLRVGHLEHPVALRLEALR